MGIGRDIGIDANPDPDRSVWAAQAGQDLQLLQRFDMDAADPRRHGFGQFEGGLPHPAEHDPVGRKPRRQTSSQFAAAHDVDPGSEFPEEPEHGEVAVGLDGVVNPVGNLGEGLAEGPVPATDRFGQVDKRRGADRVGDVGQIDPAAAQPARRPVLQVGVGQECLAGGQPIGQYALAQTASA